MGKTVEVREARVEDADIVGSLVHALLVEIVPEYSGLKSAAQYQRAAKQLLANHKGVWAFLARTASDGDIGVLTLNECAAVYAKGLFGEISELYVAPMFRSSRVGARLIDAAAAFGKQRGWSSIEVGAPSVPQWQKSVDFYQRYGFEIVGPRLDYPLS